MSSRIYRHHSRRTMAEEEKKLLNSLLLCRQTKQKKKICLTIWDLSNQVEYIYIYFRMKCVSINSNYCERNCVVCAWLSIVTQVQVFYENDNVILFPSTCNGIGWAKKRNNVIPATAAKAATAAATTANTSIRNVYKLPRLFPHILPMFASLMVEGGS